MCRKNGIQYEENVPLSGYTTMKIGGACDIMACPVGENQIAAVVQHCRKENIPFYVLGRGSNVLVSDKGYRGCIIRLYSRERHAEIHGDSITEVSGVTVTCSTDNNCTITADAGVSLCTLCIKAKQAHQTGLEFAYGIPGSVGGALYMNAGAYGGEMKDVVTSCRYLDENDEIKTMSVEDMDLSYRHSIFSEKNYIILSVTVQLKYCPMDIVCKKMDELMAKRREKQPLEYGSCGSTFKRPVGYFAAALIEECGLKGCSVGGAQVSEKHSGFVINKNNASFEDVTKLVQHIKDTVYEKKGVQLECEMIILE